MTAKESTLLEGKILAAQIQDQIKVEIENLRSKGMEMPSLVTLQLSQNPSSDWYINQQEKCAAKLGLQFQRIRSQEFSSQETLERKIKELNGDIHCHGIFISMPLPVGFDSDKALLVLDPRKDVEGIHPTSLGLIVLRRTKLIPPTAYAALQLIESTGIALRGKRAVIVGQSAIVGRPLQMLLGERRVTTTVCNTGTSTEDLKAIVSSSDIVVACAGQPGLVKGVWIKPGAVVIDIGTTEVHGKLVGDIEFEEACKHAGFITPVPGGVGPLTVTMLMQNLIHAYKWQHQLTN